MPENQKAKIWRYIDFTKFVDLLTNEWLYFARSDTLGDPFEGSTPEQNVKRREYIFQDRAGLNGGKSKEVANMLSKVKQNMVRRTFLNCWHKNEYESAFMWRIYSSEDKGIAIESTFENLKNSFENYQDEISVYEVNYIDYQNDIVPDFDGNLEASFFYKHKSYEPEREIRAVIMDIKKDEITDYESQKGPGIRVKTSLNTLIDRIHISPSAPEWFYDLVDKVCYKFGVHKEIKKSQLFQKPLY